MIRSKKHRNMSFASRTKTKPKSYYIASSVPKSSTRSDESDSSLERWKHKKSTASGGHALSTSLPTYSDSDELTRSSKKLHLSSWRPNNFAESDSLNENFSSVREPRRRRRFKRMLIEPTATMGEKTYVPLFHRRRRIRSLCSPQIMNPPKMLNATIIKLTSRMQSICPEFKGATPACNKRKRCTHDCSGSDCKEFGTVPSGSVLGMPSSLDYVMDCEQKKRSSDLSSSDCELTNDESREGDDEHSDNYIDTAGQDTADPGEESLFYPPKQFTVPVEKADLSCLTFKDITAKNDKSKLPYVQSSDARQIKHARRYLGNLPSAVAFPSRGDVPQQGSAENEQKKLTLLVDNCLKQSYMKIPDTIISDKKKRKGLNIT